jgi:hypothetical protein
MPAAQSIQGQSEKPERLFAGLREKRQNAKRRPRVMGASHLADAQGLRPAKSHEKLASLAGTTALALRLVAPAVSAAGSFDAR